MIGSVNLDLVLRSERLPAVGETVAGAEISESLGGKGANQAIAAVRMGSEVALVACVGDDAAGAQALEILRAEGVDVQQVRHTGEPTGRAAVLVDERGENLISGGTGANGSLGPQDLRGAPWSRVLLAQLEIPAATVAAALRGARELGVTGCLNATPAAGLDEVGEPPDVLIVNRVEAEQLLDAPGGAERSAPELAVAVARGRGIATVVVTDSRLGAAAAVDGGSGQTVTASSPPVEVVDTTGAGDAFAGVLAAALAEDVPLHEALRRGCVAGALACTAVGAVPSLPRRAAVLAMTAR